MLRRVSAAASILGFASAEDVCKIDSMTHNIQPVTAVNYEKVVQPALSLTVTPIWYYKGSSQADAAFLPIYDKVATLFKKKLRILAMNCEIPGNKKHCERAGVTETPFIKILPKSPQPAFVYEGAKTEEALTKILTKLMGDKINVISKKEDFVSWKSKNPTKQKVVLFSNSKKSPPMLKALSTDTVFARTVEVAFVGDVAGAGKEIAEAAGKNALKAPMFMMISKAKTMWYGNKKEHDLKDYLGIHEWININSESGMGDKVKDVSGEETIEEEVEIERVRELHGKNAQEMCFKQKNICAIYLQQGPGPLNDKTIEMITGFESAFEPKSDRGVRFSWMWADTTLQNDLVKVLEAQEAKQAEREGRDVEKFEYPTMVMVKPPRKKREEKFLSYVRLGEGQKVTKESVKAMVEKVSGGATYSKADVPKFIVRPAAKKAPKKKEEL